MKVTQSCPTLCNPKGVLQARILEWVAFHFSRGSSQPRSPTLQADSVPAELQGKPKNTGVGSLSLLQRIFPTQESNWGPLHCRLILYQLSYQGSPKKYTAAAAAAAAAAAKLGQSCLTLCDPIDSSPPGSPIPGILQARTLEWVAISFSNAWKWKGKVKLLSRVQLFETPWTVAYQAPLSLGFSRQEYWSGVPLPSPKKYTRLCLHTIMNEIARENNSVFKAKAEVNHLPITHTVKNRNGIYSGTHI